MELVEVGCFGSAVTVLAGVVLPDTLPGVVAAERLLYTDLPRPKRMIATHTMQTQMYQLLSAWAT